MLMPGVMVMTLIGTDVVVLHSGGGPPQRERAYWSINNMTPWLEFGFKAGLIAGYFLRLAENHSHRRWPSWQYGGSTANARWRMLAAAETGTNPGQPTEPCPKKLGH